jgi:hypothetical protein
MVWGRKFTSAYSLTTSIIQPCLSWYVSLHFRRSFADICKPQALISIFRAEVKEHCVAAVMLVVDTHQSPVELGNVIDRQMDDFNYIFPRQSKMHTQLFRKVTY